MPSKQKMCFVIMPFSKERKEVYTYGIKPACEKAGFKPVRVDELKGVFNINRKIIEQLYKSEVIVADLTDRNPNVFYEMGVAHAIANKTVMIVQDTGDLPFDIRNYRCIIYKQSVEGLKELEREIAECLQTLGDWQHSPSNPVQDFKPHAGVASSAELVRLQKELANKQAELKHTVPRSELQAARKQVRDHEKRVSTLAGVKAERDQLTEEVASLKQEVDQLRSQAEQPRPMAKPAPRSGRPKLRSKPLQDFSEDAVKEMLGDRGFFDSDWNGAGKGVAHAYEINDRDGDKVVTDSDTGLMWQQSGSAKSMSFESAKKYVQGLNKNKHAGFNDWRLPTLEEAMSLMEPKKNEAGLYIDPKFDSNQEWIWTADKKSASRAWAVYFDYGLCSHLPVDIDTFVRAVR